MKTLKILLTNRYGIFIVLVCGIKIISKSGSISKNPNMALCGFEIGITKLR